MGKRLKKLYAMDYRIGNTSIMVKGNIQKKRIDNL